MTGERGRQNVRIPWRISNEHYGKVVTAVSEKSSQFGLVTDDGIRPRTFDIPDIEDMLDEFFIRETRSRKWPGTISADPVTVTYYSTSADSIRVLTNVAASFWAWDRPNMPADLHFLRADGSLLLGSTPCERHVWLDVSEDELAHFRSHLPGGGKLGVFLPLDCFDEWYAAYSGDLQWSGTVTGGQSIGQVSRQVTVADDDTSLTIRVEATGRATITEDRHGETISRSFTAKDGDSLDEVFTAYTEAVFATL